MPEPSHRPQDAADRDDARDRLILGRKWAYLLHSRIFLPQPQDELERELLALLETLCACVRSDPVATEKAKAAGERLVELGCTGDEALPCTMDILGPGLLSLPEFQPVERYAQRVVLGMKAAEASITSILTARRTRPKAAALPIALINLGALCLQQNRPADAAKHLRRAEKLAGEYGDIGGSAHALELQGIATPDLHDAVELWQRAKDRFVRVAEEQGQARCLQHLGSAALIEPTVAGLIRDGRPTALDSRAAAMVALPLLEESKRLREGQPDTSLVDHYIDLARSRLT